MTIACVAGAERGGKRAEIIRERTYYQAITILAVFYFRRNRDWSELLL